MMKLREVKWGENISDVFNFAKDFFEQHPDEEWVEGKLDERPIFFNRNGTYTFERPAN